MTGFKISGGGVKPACSKGFNLPNKFINYLKTLRYYGTKTLRNVFQLLSHSTIKQNLFTVCSVHFNAREPLSALIQCLRAFCNGLLRFTRNDGLFTTHYSRLTNAAFTLAETLIVIGIIGVVAALTLPNLNHATGDKEKVTKVKKIYSALTDAVDRAQVIYGPFDTWFTDLQNQYGGMDSNQATANERFAKRVTEFMKVSKDCGFDEGCFSTAPLLNSSGGVIYDDYLSDLQAGKAYMALTSDGMSLRFGPYDSKIGVDIDGPHKGKNQMGSDIFSFGITNNILFPDDSAILERDSDYNNSDLYYGNYATAWVIEHGNLDYLKCPDELDWGGVYSCK